MNTDGSGLSVVYEGDSRQSEVIGEQREVEGIHAGISTRKRLSFLRNLAA